MNFDNILHDSALFFGADYFGIADLTTARVAVMDQGGIDVAQYPRSISIGVAMLHSIVDQLSVRPDRATAVNYRTHCYEVINTRLDQITSRIAGLLQRNGYRALPIPASKRVDDERICAVFSHKLSAHLAGLGWIGKSCLLITPDMGPRVRWSSILTDAPLDASSRPLDPQCGECRRCVDACPVGCFTGESFRSTDPRSVRYDAARCDRFFKEMRAVDPETAVCGLCVAVCPYGKPKS